MRKGGVGALGWPELTELDAYRITEIPRRPETGDAETSRDQPSDPGRTQRLAALIAAYHAGVGAKGNGQGAVAIGWVRHSAGGPVQFLAAGSGLIGSQDDGEVWLKCCLVGGQGAAAAPRRTGRAHVPAAVLAGDRRDQRRAPARGRAPHRGAAFRASRLSLEECLLAVWPGPFGGPLAAEPVTGGEIGEIACQAALAGGAGRLRG